MKDKLTQAERSAATLRAAIKAARQLFGRHGYANVSVANVVARATRSKGAIYNQFEDKKHLLRAVVDQIEGEVAVEIRGRIENVKDPIDQLVAGCGVFLDRCVNDPIARRIVILDAPAVLGWQEVRAIDSRHGLGIIVEVLEEGMAQGVIRPQPADVLAQLFLAAAVEAAMLIASAKNPAAERKRVAGPLLEWLNSLRVASGGGRRT